LEIRIGSHPCVIESGLPKLGHFPESPAFYGRGKELVDLSQSFANVNLAAYGLWGIGGIGKTVLAKVAARRNSWRYDAVAWVDIRDIAAKTTVELLRMALVRMHRGAPDDDPLEELHRRMERTPSLIVLDNLEDLPESEHAALARFIQQMPRMVLAYC
jgi:predicted ATPase